jgi:hypothetical protein
VSRPGPLGPPMRRAPRPRRRRVEPGVALVVAVAGAVAAVILDGLAAEVGWAAAAAWSAVGLAGGAALMALADLVVRRGGDP